MVWSVGLDEVVSCFRRLVGQGKHRFAVGRIELNAGVRDKLYLPGIRRALSPRRPGSAERLYAKGDSGKIALCKWCPRRNEREATAELTMNTRRLPIQ